MININPQYITDNDGNKISVVLPVQEFQKLMEELDELEDIRLYDAAKKGKQKFVNAGEAFKEIERKRSSNK